MARKDFPELTTDEYKALMYSLQSAGYSEAALINRRKARMVLRNRPQRSRITGFVTERKPRAKKKRTYAGEAREAFNRYNANTSPRWRVFTTVNGKNAYVDSTWPSEKSAREWAQRAADKTGNAYHYESEK